MNLVAPLDSETITVCDACLTASCWQRNFPCDRARAAGTRELTERELDALGREHPSHYRGS